MHPTRTHNYVISLRYVLVRPPDGAWGAKKQNGSWTGMVGMVKRKVRKASHVDNQ